MQLQAVVARIDRGRDLVQQAVQSGLVLLLLLRPLQLEVSAATLLQRLDRRVLRCDLGAQLGRLLLQLRQPIPLASDSHQLYLALAVELPATTKKKKK